MARETLCDDVKGSMVIVCFGDSLTAGFQSSSQENPAGRETPYGEFLQEQLGHTAQIQVRGICGELTGEMAMRFRQDVLRHKPAYVVVLGGTNDLGWNGRPPDIMRNLVKMYELALADRITPIPVTVPSIRVAGEVGSEGQAWIDGHIARRRELNHLIQRYAESKQLSWIDLFTATAEAETGQLAAAYSNDGLHLTTAGYRLLARLLHDQVFAQMEGAYESGGTG